MPKTVADIVAWAARRLTDAGIDSARLDATLLLAHALRLSTDSLRGSRVRPVSAAARRRFNTLLARRLAREPVSRILGRRGFWAHDFLLTPDTLDPRPDSETLIEAALSLFGDRNRPLRLLDLGTGTGCLLLTLLSELPNARGIGTDISVAALTTAQRNADRLGVADRVELVEADWFTGVAGSFDILLSNPPYVPSSDIDGLAPEVREHDPRRALDGGPDGLDAYRRIADGAPDRLASGGRLVLEIGADQAAAVTELLRAAGFQVAPPRQDLAGRDRVLTAWTETSGDAVKRAEILEK